MKNGVHAEVHTIVHTTKQPQYIDGEWEKGMTKGSIRIEAASPRDKLEPQSRLNYAKVYTVECNVKVCFIGKVHVDFRQRLVADYNEVHPQLRYGGNGGGTQSSAYSTDAVSHTGAWPDTYNNSGYGAGGVEYPLAGSDPLTSPGNYRPNDFERRHTDAIQEEEVSYEQGDEGTYSGGEEDDGKHGQPEATEPEDLYSAK